jgi:S-adenosylmethionine synthetase
MKTFFTSESVTEGHPDKVADQISDAVLDSILAEDPQARVACEVLVNTGLVVVSGEITTSAYVDISKIAREKICSIGYNRHETCFDGNTCAVVSAIDEQSPDIAQGVDRDVVASQGAGDQGMMFGFACDHTPELMPLPITMAHALTKRLSDVRKDGTLYWLLPDGKAQVTFEYHDKKPTRVDTVVVSAQHQQKISLEELRAEILEHVIKPILKDWIDEETVFHINPTGKFVIGGPQGDCGLTGRKIIVDTYGGWSRHGGGAFSGKDPSKTDRSGAYAARWVAKNIVAHGLATSCEVQLAYAIGVAEPVSIFCETFGTGTVDNQALEKIVRKNFDLTPAGITRELDLLRPIYSDTAAYGHFGRPELDLPWERIISLEV